MRFASSVAGSFGALSREIETGLMSSLEGAFEVRLQNEGEVNDEYPTLEQNVTMQGAWILL